MGFPQHCMSCSLPAVFSFRHPHSLVYLKYLESLTHMLKTFLEGMHHDGSTLMARHFSMAGFLHILPKSFHMLMMPHPA